MRMVTGQITVIAEDTTVTASIEGKVRRRIPTIFNQGQPPVLYEQWVFLLDGGAIIGLGPTYNWPT